MQKHTHIVHNAKQSTIQWTCAGTAQIRLTDSKDTKLKKLMTQQTTVLNQGRLQRMPDVNSQETFKLKKPQLYWSPIILAFQYAKSYQTTIFCHTYKIKRKGFPSIVWQQQMKTTYRERYNRMHPIQKETPIHQITANQHISTMFRHLPENPENESQFINPHYQQDPYWNDDLFDHEKLEYKQNFNKRPEQIEDHDLITDSHVSDKKRRHALLDSRTFNPQLPNTSPSPKFRPTLNFTNCQTPVIDTEIFPQLQPIPGKNTNFLPF